MEVGAASHYVLRGVVQCVVEIEQVIVYWFDIVRLTGDDVETKVV